MIKIQIKKQMHTPQGLKWLDIDMTIAPGEFISLYGQSGAGKTTLLRILAGLTKPEEGSIEVNGEMWFDSRRKINLSVQQRQAGFVFQESTLFPNMTVQENLSYACRNNKPLVDQWLLSLGLEGLEKQKPAQLSGGQKQRVALARAFLCKPKILLLDEPLTDLDMSSRLGLQDEIIKLYQKTKITTILVSHDLGEVFRLARKVFVMDEGRIVKSGVPQEVFLSKDVSGKFKFTAEIIEIIKDGVVNILTLNIGNHITKVIASDEELKGLSVGSKIIVASKAFNPLILKST